MVALDEVKAAVGQIVHAVLPSVDVIRVDARDRFDSDGQRSLFITTIINQRPPDSRQLAQNSNDIVRQLRAWLADRDDERFPYFDILTVEDERELQTAED